MKKCTGVSSLEEKLAGRVVSALDYESTSPPGIYLSTGLMWDYTETGGS